MSRPRSQSPHYRRFPWEEPGFEPFSNVAELGRNSQDRSQRSREAPGERWDFFRDDVRQEGQRRSNFQDDHQFRNRRPPDREEFYCRRPSPHRDLMGYDGWKHSPFRDVGGDGERRRGEFREQFQGFEKRGRSPHSPLRLSRERSLPTSQAQSDRQQREPLKGWRREEQGKVRGRFRDISPSARSDDKRGGAGRERGGRRNTQGPNRDRQWEEPHQERKLPLKRQRREMDDTKHPGYRNEDNFGEQRYSLDTARDRFKVRQGSHTSMDSRYSGPLVFEHDHSFTDGGEHWEQLDDRRGLDADFDRPQSPSPKGSSQERFRTLDSRLDDREDTRGHRFQDNLREARRSPMQQDRENHMRFGNRDGPPNQKGRSGPRPTRGRVNHGQHGRPGPPRSQLHLEKTSQAYQDSPREEQRTGPDGYRSIKTDCYEQPIERNPNWAEDHKLQQWEHDRPRRLSRHAARIDLDPKMPRQRERGWTDQKTNNMAVVAEETLTIKVDMSRPVNQSSLLCYSSDRQLSLDLVNVGRQRLDFLPMLEHSGTYQETAVHTGTFAQEIITLVHQVKEQYFRDDGITLNERFSAPQKDSYTEEETEELTLDERFSSNRGFSLNMNSLADDNVQRQFSRITSVKGLNQQPERDPGDLRHDLERRRQERLEGVKVTIPGNNMSIRPLVPVSELPVEMSQMEDDDFSSWPQDQSRRREDSQGQRRAPSRLNIGAQRRNNRGGNRGQMRRPNNRNNPAGPNW